jgi:hypothetical protein
MVVSGLWIGWNGPTGSFADNPIQSTVMTCSSDPCPENPFPAGAVKREKIIDRFHARLSRVPRYSEMFGDYYAGLVKNPVPLNPFVNC